MNVKLINDGTVDVMVELDSQTVLIQNMPVFELIRLAVSKARLPQT